jgi:Flp pilus assembly protein TadG
MKYKHRNNRGQGLLECVAATVFVMPILITIVFVLTEISQFFLIQAQLNNAAREAARNLAIDYVSVVGIDTNQALQASYVYNNIQLGNIVKSPNQFNAVFDEVDIPNTVTVTCTYTSGQNGLAKFPSIDPLHLGNKILLSSTAVYRLE